MLCNLYWEQVLEESVMDLLPFLLVHLVISVYCQLHFLSHLVLKVLGLKFKLGLSA